MSLHHSNPLSAVGRPCQAALALALAVALPLGSMGVRAEEENDDDADDAVSETVVVTGTRLNEDPTGRLLVISAEDIAALGLSSTEEVIRSLPHNFSTINSFNNLNYTGIATLLEGGWDPLGLGVSTANLRGLGSRNTLVLVNGRRIAGAAGNDQFFANIRHIPSASIERVEVLLDGGGSVYGSDAIGGVINIVLKSDYAGIGGSARTETSSTGGDQNRLSGQFGYSWNTGNVSATVSRVDSQPVKYEKTGYTTGDYSPFFGGDQSYNLTYVLGPPRSGAVSRGQWPIREIILPPGHDGRNAQPEDFVPYERARDHLDIVNEDAGPAKEDTSWTLNVRQELFERLALTAEVLHTKAASERTLTSFGGRVIPVPASNAFNNFGYTVYVDYEPVGEEKAGLIPPNYQTDLTKQTRYVIGAEYSLGERGRVALDYTRSTSGASGVGWQFGHTTDGDDEALDARLAALLASDDPSVAVNLFGDGTAQNPGIREFLLPQLTENRESYTFQWDLTTRLNAYQLPGGWLNVAAGLELREEALEHLDTDYSQEYELLYGVGLPRPGRDLTAGYVEALVPLFGSDNARRGVQSLSVKVAARSDRYETQGAQGNDNLDCYAPPATTKPNIVDAKFRNVAPEIGVFYKPLRTLELRVKRSEGFRAPTFGQLFSRSACSYVAAFPLTDPLTGEPAPGVRIVTGPNPNLKPETSETFNIGARWSPQWGGGLLLTVDWSEVDIRNRIASRTELQGLLAPEVFGNLTEFFVRGEDGRLVESRYLPVNIAQRVSETVDVHISRPFETDFGRFVAELDYNRVLDQFDAPLPGSPPARFLGESVGVDRYKLTGKVTWVSGPSSATLVARHIPAYINNDWENSFRNFPLAPVSSYTVWDASGKHSWDNGLTLRVGGRNIFDRKPPFMLSGQYLPFDTSRVDLRGRVFYLEVSYDLEL